MNQGGHGMISHPKMPTSLIDKYPNGSKQQQQIDSGSMGMPRAVRETKNNQLFEKYLNRQHEQNAATNRKPSMEMNANTNSNITSHNGKSSMNINESDYSGQFALPSLGGNHGIPSQP